MVSITAESVVVDRLGSIRRAGWLLIAAAVTFVASLLFLFIVGADYYKELTDAADAAGKTIAGVPEVERARVAGRHQPFFVISVMLFVVPFVVLALGLREIYGQLRSADEMTARLARAAWWGGVACLAIWVVVSVVEFGFLADPNNLPPLARDFNAFGPPLIVIAASVGAVAVSCAALALRRARIAPRIALAVVIIVGIILLVSLVNGIATGSMPGVPQFLPQIAALLLGIGLVRSRVATQP